MDLGSSNGTRLNGVEIPIKVGADAARRRRRGDRTVPADVPRRSGARAAAPAGAAGAAAAAGPAGHTVVLPPDLPARLIVSTPEWTREFPLKKDSVTLGREPDNDIVIDAEAVSRHHAVMKRRGPAYLITDLGSTNGLDVAGQLVKEKLLAPGDYVCIGHSVTLEYRGAEDLAADMAAAAPAAPGAARRRRRRLLRRRRRRRPSTTSARATRWCSGRGDETSVHMAHPQVSAQHAEVQRQAGPGTSSATWAAAPAPTSTGSW